MRIFSLLLAFSFLILVGCNKESTLEVKIKDVAWKEETVRNGNMAYKTVITITDDRKLTFEGIHDFKIGSHYKIKVRESDAGLVKFEPSQGKKEKEEAQTFTPTKNTTSDKIVFKVVVDKSGNVLASEEIGPEVKTAKNDAESTKK
jgi:hypothetical protein